MRVVNGLVVAVVALVLTACGSGAQVPSSLVVTEDRELGDMASAILADLASRSGLSLKSPVRLEKRDRGALVRYLEHKLDEELPDGEAEARVHAYALFGLVPDSLDLRAVLLALYTEQVAGFYDPDSTALFILDDQPAEALQGLLVHELVHAIQDQTADLNALTDPALSNDQRTAAQAAIEGHATLVMLEYLTEKMRGASVDLAEIPDFAASLRPALEEGIEQQFPALAGAPRVIRESLLFPYIEGAGFVQGLWRAGERVSPFGAYLPESTEQVMTGDLSDAPAALTLTVDGGRVVDEDNLGRLELGVFLDAHGVTGGADLSEGWRGDRYALVALPGAGNGLVWAVAWDDSTSRDRFVEALRPRLSEFASPTRLEAWDSDAGAVALLRVALPDDVTVRVEGLR